LKERGDVAAMRSLAEWTDNGHTSDWQKVERAYLAMLEDNAHTFRLALSAPRSAIACDELRSIRIPVLVVNGAETQPYFSQVGHRLATCLPSCLRVVVSNASHDVPNNNPAAFNSELTRFPRRLVA
jgi:pimeloyl-ACP methyl ester carboxylesterase